jgi:hypothetical protein
MPVTRRGAAIYPAGRLGDLAFAAGHDLAALRFAAARRRTDGAGGFFSHRHLACVLPVKLVPGQELQPTIHAGERGLETSTEKAMRLDHDHAGSVAVRMAVGQPKEGHGLSVAGQTGERE